MLLLGEWERIDPVLQRGFASSPLDAVVAALDAAPAELLATDPAIGAFMREMAQAALALGVPAQAPKAWPVRAHSPTTDMPNVLIPRPMRPTLLLMPPFVWHGLQNLENGTGSFINFFDRVYCYANPDEWRLRVENDTNPCRLQRVRARIVARQAFIFRKSPCACRASRRRRRRATPRRGRGRGRV